MTAAVVSAGEALAALRAANGLSDDLAAVRFSIRIGPFTVLAPNAAWRRRAVLAHDLHHLITGYPCTVRGEFEMAAWEVASGGFASFGAAAVCGVLVFGGLALSPGRTVAAFRAGRRWRNLHREPIDEAFLARPWADVITERRRRPTST